MADEIIYDFGVRLRQLRKDRGLSQGALAKRLGVSPQTIYRYENNVQSPSLESAKQLAIILRTSLDYLVGLDNNYTIMLPSLTDEERHVLNTFLRVFVDHSGRSR